MLLQQIVEKLDQELGRLHRLREIVAGLAHGPRLEDPVAELVGETAAEEVAKTVPTVRNAEPKPRARRGFGLRVQAPKRQNGVERPASALTSAIPAGPVVVSAATVAKQIAAKEQVREATKPVVEGTLGAMIRALGQQGAI